jgi:chitodextrinase
MRNKLFIISVITIASVVCFFGGHLLFADESTFTTSLRTFGVDSTPPSIPTDLVATPASDTQIDLSWTPSTDNISVAGYRVFRDGIFLATTTIALYDDLDLSPATAYTYTVQAFDPSLNISGQSDPATATTTNTVITTATSSPTLSSSSSFGQLPPLIYDIIVVPGSTEAQISFKTNVFMTAKISWGTSPDFESGSIATVAYAENHRFVIPGLSQEATYYARIEATDYTGQTIFVLVSFVTTGEAAAHVMPNPTDAVATAGSADIRLAWVNPSDVRFIGIDIVRSDSFFPRDASDGMLIYQGAGSSFIDTDTIPGTTYYYAIFARGSDGSHSSGVLLAAHIPKPGESVPPVSSDIFGNLPQALNVDPMIASLTLGDFDFIQGGRFLANDGTSSIAFDGGSDLTIRLPYARVPEILKTIAISIIDPTDQSKRFIFLLRVNDDKTYYEASVGPIGSLGRYPFMIIVVDYRHQALKRINGALQAITFQIETLPSQGTGEIWFFWLLILVLILIILFLIFEKRRRKRVDSPYYLS